jgi:hypothetical protein
MEHQRAIELLPWFLNGSLAAAEREAIERLLAGSAELRAELEATRAAARIHATRLPPQALLDHVLGTQESGLPPALVARLIAGDARYQEEVALLRTSLEALETGPQAEEAPSLAPPVAPTGRVAPGRFGRQGSRRWLALAAGVAGISMAALVVWQAQHGAPSPSAVLAQVQVVEGSALAPQALQNLMPRRADEAQRGTAGELDRLPRTTTPTHQELDLDYLLAGDGARPLTLELAFRDSRGHTQAARVEVRGTESPVVSFVPAAFAPGELVIAVSRVEADGTSAVLGDLRVELVDS